MPHGHCYLWTPGLLWGQVVTNGLIGVSYVAIAWMLWTLVRRGDYVPFRGMATAFGAFIIFCGLTHFMDILVIWEPFYWADLGLRAVTAIASVGTAVMLPPLVPKAIALARGARAARERGVELETALHDLERVYDRTKEIEEAKSRFFANVSHELRTPLSLVLGPTERLLEDENLDAEHRKEIEVIARNARSLTKHVNDILDVSSLEAGSTPIRHTEANVARVVRGVVAQFDAAALDRDIDLVVATEAGTAEVDVDKVSRIVLNLLSNAFKFTPDGGTVRVTQKLESGRVVVEVADSGPGVPEESRDAIFERFWQADDSDTRAFGGTGLGLSICRDFVALHEGTIECRTAPGGGALFRVDLPATAPSGTTVHTRREKVDSSLRVAVDQTRDELRNRSSADTWARTGQPRVVVAEDNRDMNEFIVSALEGYDVEAAFDGDAALKLALQTPPDLIVTDLMMPGTGGEELVSSVQDEPTLRNVPIIVLTAKADHDLKVSLLAHGARDYLLKPFSVQELRVRVANQVELKRTRDVLMRELQTQETNLEEMAETIATRKRELQAALESMRLTRDQAERANRLKTDFIGLVSHELRTPIATLDVQLELLRRDSEKDQPPSDTRIERIRRAMIRVRSLVDGLLEYARVEHGRIEPHESMTDVPELLSDTADVLEIATNDDTAVVVEVDPEMAPVLTDPRLLRVIVHNLASNAVKFAAGGEVRIGAEREESELVVSVSDDGPGIADDEREDMFRPFWRGGAATEQQIPGVGLGLSIVQEMTRALNGTIEMESTVGSGTRFTLRFPLREQNGDRQETNP